MAMAPIPTGAERRCAAAALLLAASTQAVPADWTVVPEISVTETYTDNAFVGTLPRRHDFVTQITPGIRIDGRSPRLTAHLNYRPSALLHASHSEGNDLVNNLDAFGRLEAVERLFFIEALGSASQHFISPFAAQPADITTVTPNRSEIRTFSLSPYLRGELGRSLEYELRNRNTWTTSDNSGLGDFRTTRWTGRVARPVRLFGWALEYDDTTIHREDVTVRADQESRLFRARLFYQPDESWRLSASAGREQNNFVLQQTERETIRGAGLSWRPGPRTTADFEYEHRFFGPSRVARLSHRDRLTAWNVGYSRNTSTFQEQVLNLPPGNTAALLDVIFTARIPDPVQRASAVQEFIQATGTPAFLSGSLAFYTERVFLREGVDASFALLGARNSIAFTAFSAQNTSISADATPFQPADAFLLAERFKQRGFGARVDHRLTPSTSIGAGVSRIDTRQQQPTQADARNDHYTLNLTHTVSPKTTTFAGVSITRFKPDDPGLGSQGANAVFVGVNHRF